MRENNSVVAVDTKKRKLVDLGEMINIANSSAVSKGIYFVKMNVSDMEKRIAGTPHELRPFVAVEKTDDSKLKGYYTTSNLKKLEFSRQCFKKYRTILSNKKYRLNKSSVVLLEKMVVIDENSILREIDSIDNEDLAKLIKMRNLYEGNCLKLKGKYLNIADVIINNGIKYLIYQKDNSFAYGFKIQFKGKVATSRVDLNSTCCYFKSGEDLYKIYFNESKAFSKSDSFILCDCMTEDVVDFVRARKVRDRYINKGRRRENNKSENSGKKRRGR